ncbi:MAG TPA: sarcosine oxidase subunit delta [Thermoleophilaceae bacterium]|jgi:sarcosine oxidase subunit delta|nr:sarcosine oxidase subunit delta [Thermoleophilaceae bacterium]
MSYVLICPNCGPREVTDFGYGGELNPRPKKTPTLRELGEYNYFRRNVAGVQREWWVHRSGCGDWFIAERDTRTNQVHWTKPVSEVFGDGPDTAGAAAGGADGGGAAGGHGV